MKEYLNNYDELVDTEKDYYNLLELLTEMIQKKLSDKYWIYRIFKVNDEPTFFKVNGKDFFEKFLLCAYTYTANTI